MKHEGRSLSRYTGHVTIVREDEAGNELEQLRFAIQQLPSTWPEECERQLPPPEAPVVGKDKDASGNWVPRHDHDDPKYKAEVEVWRRRTAAKKIHDALIDPNVTWETDIELRASNPREFYDGIYAELDAAFSRGEINTFVMKINAIDMVGGADVALAEEGLFQQLLGSSTLSRLEEIAAEALDADDGSVR